MSVTETSQPPPEAVPRYATLVAGYDGSERAADGLALARLLADATGAELLVAAVVPHEFPYAPGTADARLRRACTSWRSRPRPTR